MSHIMLHVINNHRTSLDIRSKSRDKFFVLGGPVIAQLPLNIYVLQIGVAIKSVWIPTVNDLLDSTPSDVFTLNDKQTAIVFCCQCHKEIAEILGADFSFVLSNLNRLLSAYVQNVTCRVVFAISTSYVSRYHIDMTSIGVLPNP